MLRSVRGIVARKAPGYCVLETGAFGLKVSVNARTAEKLREGEEAKLACSMHLKDTAVELYGFENETALSLFEMLISVSGIGPRTALHIMDADAPERIAAAIIEGKSDFLAATPGIGKKTAARVVMELRDKLHLGESSEIAKTLDVDADVEDVLVNLGYNRRDVKRVVQSLGAAPEKLEDRIKAALKRL